MDTTTATRLNEQTLEEIRVLLARRRMSARQLAALMGASEMWLSRRMRGAQALDLVDLQRIADALGVPPQALLGEATRGYPTHPPIMGPSRPSDRRPGGRPAGPRGPSGPSRTSRVRPSVAA